MYGEDLVLHLVLYVFSGRCFICLKNYCDGVYINTAMWLLFSAQISDVGGMFGFVWKCAAQDIF